MFDKLIKDPRHLAKYESGPFVEERRRYLVHLDQCGYARLRLSHINLLLLAIANYVDADGNSGYSPKDLVAIAKKWMRDRPDSGASEKTRTAREKEFLFYAKRWMKFLGQLVEDESTLPFSRELDEFLSHVRTERGFAEATIDNRRRSLVPFFQWLNEQGYSSLKQVSLVEILQYQNVGAQRGWKRTTISFHSQSLRSFFRYATSQGWCSVVAKTIIAPRLYAYEGLPEGPSWEDVKKLLANEQGDSPVQIRNRAMFFLFAIYGFRLSEVRLLQLDDLDWERERIVLRRSKLRKTQEYPLNREVGDAVLRYLQEVRPRSIHRQVFLSLRQPYRPLSVGAIGTQVQKRMRRISTKFARFGPHALRHACATHLLSEGFTLKQIGDHLGHVSVAATQLYAKVDLPMLREVGDLNMSDLIMYTEHAERNQTPLIPRGELEALREVANLRLGVLL